MPAVATTCSASRATSTTSSARSCASSRARSCWRWWRPRAPTWCTSTGGQLLRGRVNSRKKLLKEQIKKLPIFRAVVDALQRSEDRRADEDAFREIFALHLPAEDSEALLKTVIDWGRYAELLGYSPDDQEVYLDHLD